VVITVLGSFPKYLRLNLTIILFITYVNLRNFRVNIFQYTSAGFVEVGDIDRSWPFEPNYFTCNHRAVYEISYEVASLCNCSGNYGGSGGRKNILKKPRGV
jgi:hypothetical protein